MVETIRRNLVSRATPQSEQSDPAQVANSAGGYSFQVDSLMQVRRFLILGTTGGSYYAGERALTRENDAVLRRALRQDHRAVLDMIADISSRGLASKNDWAIYALAVACSDMSLTPSQRQQALGRIPAVCRTGAHLLMFVEYIDAMRGWGSGLRRALVRWYDERPLDDLALQVVKYGRRGTWSHADVLRKVRPAASRSPLNHGLLYRYIVRGTTEQYRSDHHTMPDPPKVIVGREMLHAQTSRMTPLEVAAIVRTYDLPREAVPPEFQSSPPVIESILYGGEGRKGGMPLGALIRNLANMTRAGVLSANSDAEKYVLGRLSSTEALRASRIHPLNILTAYLTYRAGVSRRTEERWSPLPRVVDALDAAFYLSFGNVEPVGKPVIFGVDISGSMDVGTVGGVDGFTPRVAAAAMALVSAATEQQHVMLGFSHRLIELDISPKMRLGDVMTYMARLPFGGTDASLPIAWAIENRVPCALFTVLSDSETWAGVEHAHESLVRYRNRVGSPGRFANVNFVANRFTLANPNDPLSMNFIGFDASMPAVLAAFGRGEV